MTIDIAGVSKHFDGYRVFDDLSLRVEDNEFVSLLGPSGCGKTTLLRMVAGLEQPTAGQVRVKDEVVRGPRLDTTLVFQNFRLLPWKSVEDNVGYGLRLRGVSKRDARRRAQPFIEMVGLAGREKLHPYHLSGGMQQRVGLARALAISPDVLLMDEPFGALDAQTRELMQYELLDIWSRDRQTVLFVTHSIDEALVLSDRVVLMQANPGRIVEKITVPFDRPRGPSIRQAERFIELRARMWDLLGDGTGERQPGRLAATEASPSGD